jgi:hypothetical protein
VIGVEGCDLSDDSNFLRLFLCATMFLKTDISFFTFVFIKNCKAGHAVRISNDYLQKLVDLSDGKEVDKHSIAVPIPLLPDEELLSSLEGVELDDTVVDKHNEDFYKMMIDTWKLLQYRQALGEGNAIEKDWLASLETEYSERIIKLLSRVQQGPDSIGELGEKIGGFLFRETKLSTVDILAAMNERAMITAKRTFSSVNI